MADYRMFDTKRGDGVYVRFEREELPDQDADPREYLFQDEEYREEDQARLDAWQAGDWHFVGIRAKATVWIVRNGTGTMYELASPGLWGIESDSEESHFAETYADEKAQLLGDIRAMHEVQEID